MFNLGFDFWMWRASNVLRFVYVLDLSIGSVLCIETEQTQGNLKVQSERNSYNYSSINQLD